MQVSTGYISLNRIARLRETLLNIANLFSKEAMPNTLVFTPGGIIRLLIKVECLLQQCKIHKLVCDQRQMC